MAKRFGMPSQRATRVSGGDKVIPMGGGWVIVTRRLPGNLPQVPLFSMFYAKPGNVFKAGFFTEFLPEPLPEGAKPGDEQKLYRWRHTRTQLLPDEIKTAELLDDAGIALEMQVQIRAPDGDVTLNPYEWTPCGDVQPFVDSIGEGVTLHEYGEAAQPDRGTAWKLFYMQQRGIPRRDAVAMLLGSLNKPGLFWLEMAAEVARVFDRGDDFVIGQIGQVNRDRRAAAHARSQLQAAAVTP